MDTRQQLQHCSRPVPNRKSSMIAERLNHHSDRMTGSILVASTASFRDAQTSSHSDSLDLIGLAP